MDRPHLLPNLEIDDLLTRFQARVTGIVTAPDGTPRVLDAIAAIGTSLDPDEILGFVVEAAASPERPMITTVTPTEKCWIVSAPVPDDLNSTAIVLPLDHSRLGLLAVYWGRRGDACVSTETSSTFETCVMQLGTSRKRNGGHRRVYQILISDHDRIAQDVNDDLIRRLNRVALQLTTVTTGTDHAQVKNPIRAALTSMNEVINEIHTTVFSLRQADRSLGMSKVLRTE